MERNLSSIFVLLSLFSLEIYCSNETENKSKGPYSLPRYEPLFFEEIETGNSKGFNNLQSNRVSIRSEENGGHLSIEFRAFRTDFRLSVSKSEKIAALNENARIKTYDNEGREETSSINGNEFDFYVGTVLGIIGSKVNGYLSKNVFECSIVTNNETFYIESSAKHFDAKLVSFNGLIYRMSDIMFRVCQKGILPCIISPDLTLNGKESIGLTKIGLARREWRPLKPTSPSDEGEELINNVTLIEKQMPFSGENIPKGEETNYRRHTNRKCGVLITIDHFIYNSFKGKIAHFIKGAIQTVQIASAAFQLQDFNGDGEADNIHLSVYDVKIYKNKLTKGYTLSEDNLTPIETLNRFSKDLLGNRYCLSILFTSRDYFPSLHLGMAFKANANPKGPDGGICAPIGFYPALGRARLNTIVLSTVNGGQPLPKATLQLTLLHLLGHSFGANHDSGLKRLCTPGTYVGNYVMFPVYSNYFLENTMMFSPCSLKEINPVIRNKGWCLFHDDRQTICGNGILEKGEECDCGSTLTCKYQDKCCIPPGHKNSCTVNRTAGYQCSPLTYPCCTENCRIVEKTEHRTCSLSAQECTRYSVCEGEPDCPIPDHKKRLISPCAGGALTCRDGICKSTACQDRKLKDCECESPVEHRCHVCCYNASRGCQSSVAFRIWDRVKRPYIKPGGSSCYGGEGICDSGGFCNLEMNPDLYIDEIAEGQLRKDQIENIPLKTWPFILTLIFIGLILFLLIISLLSTGKKYRQIRFFERAVRQARLKIENNPIFGSSSTSPEDGAGEESVLEEELRDKASRLSALFPFAPLSEIKNASCQFNLEADQVQTLINRGHALRINFQTIEPPPLDYPIN